MKPQELRIGNWVITKTAYDKPTEIQVHSIGANGINETNGHAIPFDDLEGIVLTQQLLDKCGNLNHYFESGDDIQPSNDADNIILMACGEYQISKPLAYLHQFQNAWFALTNEEII